MLAIDEEVWTPDSGIPPPPGHEESVEVWKPGEGIPPPPTATWEEQDAHDMAEWKQRKAAKAEMATKPMWDQPQFQVDPSRVLKPGMTQMDVIAAMEPKPPEPEELRT